jgi:prevent-host-death family protein
LYKTDKSPAETAQHETNAQTRMEKEMSTHFINSDGEDIGEAREDGRIYVGSSEARGQLPEVLNRAAYRGDRFVIERHGKAVAAVVPLADLDHLEELEDAADLEALREARGDTELVDWDVAKDELNNGNLDDQD